MLKPCTQFVCQYYLFAPLIIWKIQTNSEVTFVTFVNVVLNTHRAHFTLSRAETSNKLEPVRRRSAGRGEAGFSWRVALETAEL